MDIHFFVIIVKQFMVAESSVETVVLTTKLKASHAKPVIFGYRSNEPIDAISDIKTRLFTAPACGGQKDGD